MEKGEGLFLGFDWGCEERSSGDWAILAVCQERCGFEISGSFQTPASWAYEWLRSKQGEMIEHRQSSHKIDVQRLTNGTVVS